MEFLLGSPRFRAGPDCRIVVHKLGAQKPAAVVARLRTWLGEESGADKAWFKADIVSITGQRFVLYHGLAVR